MPLIDVVASFPWPETAVSAALGFAAGFLAGGLTGRHHTRRRS